MNNVLLDTNILIYLLQGSKPVREILENKTWFISFINEMELLIKPDMASIEIKSIQALLNECFVVEMNNAIKAKAIENAQRYKLKLADSIILASAQINNIPFLTADSAFKKIALDSNDVLLFIP